jgi:hypothetical protein
MLNYSHLFLQALFFTVFIETAVLFLLIRIFWKKEKFIFSNTKLLFTGFLTSFATIPYVWYVFPVLIYRNQNIALFISELFAFFVEGLIYYFMLNLSIKRAFIVSFVCNVISFLLGRLLF